MATPQCITLLTDLGTTDAYVGIVKGILLARAPESQIIDLTHAADRDSLYASAYMLATAYPYFPPGTVHLVLADPGSSPERRIIAAECESQFLVAPDDGVGTLLLTKYPPSKVVAVDQSRFLLQSHRHTFHSRLIYAPAAAALVSRKAILEDLGTPLSEWTQLPHAIASTGSDGSIRGEVVHIDRFGNLVTNIRASQLPPEPLRIKVGDALVDRICHNFSDVETGHVLAIIGTTGNLEICINRGNAAERLFATNSQHVSVYPE